MSIVSIVSTTIEHKSLRIEHILQSTQCPSSLRSGINVHIPNYSILGLTEYSR